MISYMSARAAIFRDSVNPFQGTSTMATSIEGIYAGGDLVNGGDTAVRAVGDGKRAAFAIDEYLRGKMGKPEPR